MLLRVTKVLCSREWMTVSRTPGITRLQQHRPPQLARPNSSSFYSTSPSPTASSISTYSYSSDHSPEARDDDEIDFGLQLQLQAFTGLGNPAMQSGLQRSTTPDRSLEPQYSGGSAGHFQAGRSNSWPTPPPHFDEMSTMPLPHQHNAQHQQHHPSDLSWTRLLDAAHRAHNTGAHHHPSHPHQYDMQQRQGDVFNGGAGAQTMAFPYQQHGGHHNHHAPTHPHPAYPYLENQHAQQHQLHGHPQPYQPTHQGLAPDQPQHSALGSLSFPAGDDFSDLQDFLTFDLPGSGSIDQYIAPDVFSRDL